MNEQDPLSKIGRSPTVSRMQIVALDASRNAPDPEPGYRPPDPIVQEIKERSAILKQIRINREIQEMNRKLLLREGDARSQFNRAQQGRGRSR